MPTAGSHACDACRNMSRCAQIANSTNSKQQIELGRRVAASCCILSMAVHTPRSRTPPLSCPHDRLLRRQRISERTGLRRSAVSATMMSSRVHHFGMWNTLKSSRLKNLKCSAKCFRLVGTEGQSLHCGEY